MILVDSSVWIDFFRGTVTKHTDFLQERLGSAPVAIGDLMITEVLQGFRDDADYKIAKSLLLDLTILNIGGLELALAAAANYRALRASGITVRKTIDTLIATFCIRESHELLCSDRDFAPFVDHLGLRAAVGV